MMRGSEGVNLFSTMIFSAMIEVEGSEEELLMEDDLFVIAPHKVCEYEDASINIVSKLIEVGVKDLTMQTCILTTGLF